MRTTIRHYSTVYKLVHGTSLEHYLQILKEHLFHADHDATFFFLQGENDEITDYAFFRIYRDSQKSFCIQKGVLIVTKDAKTETWSVIEHYGCDDIKKAGEDLFHYFDSRSI